jgi:uncharacterized protein (DUF1330 family)
MGYVDPDRENWEAFKSLPRDTPIHMLNLIRFRDVADYPEGHPHHGKDLTGTEAYAFYRTMFQDLVRDSGAAMVWEGSMECVVTGPTGEWDEAFVMGYPSTHAFMAMLKDPVYVTEILPHRTAAVADSRLIRFGAPQ